MQSPVVSDPVGKGEWKPAEGSVLCLLRDGPSQERWWWGSLSGAGIRHRACASQEASAQVINPGCYFPGRSRVLLQEGILVQDIMEDTMRSKDNTPMPKPLSSSPGTLSEAEELLHHGL